MAHHGGCLCGGVRWTLSGEALSAGYCHCTHCQRRTGTAAAASARVRRSELVFDSGLDLLRSFEPPGGVPKVFCSRCGSAIFSGDLDADEQVALRLGGFDGDPGIRPTYRQFTDYAASWEPIPDDGLPRHGERRSA